MTSAKTPVTIKKYANRRLYNTGSSTYVTLEDLAAMVKRGDDFAVIDAKNGDDITRSVLAQIIFEQENKHGQSLLPITFLRQLIRFYGTGMQLLVPSFLEMSLSSLAKEGGVFGPAFSQALPSAARPMLAQMEEQARQNMAIFRQALTMFAPFAGGEASGAAPAGAPPEAPARPEAAAPAPGDQPPPDAEPAQPRSELADMRRQLDELQRRIETLVPKG